MIRAALLVLAVPVLARAELVAKGAHVGGNVAGIESNGGPSLDAPFRPGLVMGVYLRNRFTRTFSLQIEANVEQKRAKELDCAVTPCMETADIGLWYLAVPVLLRFDLLPGPTMFHLDVGPEVALTIGGGQTDKTTDEYTRFEDLNPGNIGLAVGTGVEFAAGPGAVTVDFRYKRWLAPVSDEGDAKVELTHQIWLVTGYAFP